MKKRPFSSSDEVALSRWSGSVGLSSGGLHDNYLNAGGMYNGFKREIFLEGEKIHDDPN
jgi:hypothetical protein